MPNDNDLLLIVVIASLTLLFLVAVLMMVLIAAQNARLRHRNEKQELEQQMLLEVARAEKEATQATMAEIGRELHDNVGQLLTATQIGMTNHFEDQVESDDALQSIVYNLEASISEVGRLGRALNDEHWKNRDLFEAIVEESARLEKIGSMIVQVDQRSKYDQLKDHERVMLYRSFQEVIQNALKYSHAKVVNIVLKSDPFLMRISDNGDGFDVSVKTGSGINNIRHRAQLIGMVATLKSKPGEGSIWEFRRIT